MTAALKLERDPLDEVIRIINAAGDQASRASRLSGKPREAALRVLHTYVAVAADKTFALIPRPPVAVEPGHEWMIGINCLAHAFPRDESGTYGRSACGSITKRRGLWFKSTSSTRCKNCARMVAG